MTEQQNDQEGRQPALLTLTPNLNPPPSGPLRVGYRRRTLETPYTSTSVADERNAEETDAEQADRIREQITRRHERHKAPMGERTQFVPMNNARDSVVSQQAPSLSALLKPPINTSSTGITTDANEHSSEKGKKKLMAQKVQMERPNGS